MKKFNIKEWQESNLNEAAPKMKVDPDAAMVHGMIRDLGEIGRRATGSNVKKEIKATIKRLQSLRGAIQVGR